MSVPSENRHHVFNTAQDFNGSLGPGPRTRHSGGEGGRPDSGWRASYWSLPPPATPPVKAPRMGGPGLQDSRLT